MGVLNTTQVQQFLILLFDERCLRALLLEPRLHVYQKITFPVAKANRRKGVNNASFNFLKHVLTEGHFTTRRISR